MSDLVEVALIKILQTKTYTVIILGNEHKKFSIYMEPTVGHLAQEFFSNEKAIRPKTFDFIDRVFLGMNTKLLRVVIYDIQESTFFAKLLLEQEEEQLTHLIEIDARPSDSLVLALRSNAPIYCSSKVLEQTVPYIDVEA